MKTLAKTVSLIACLVTAGAMAAPVIGVDLPPFGAQTRGNQTGIHNRMEHARIRWGRDDLCLWNIVEPTAGVYVFNDPNSNADLRIAMMRERGIEPFPILCYGNPLYDGGVGPHTEAGRTAFANYCHAVVSHFRDDVTFWEIWNEPNISQFWGRTPSALEYTQLVAAAAPRIREANPDAVIAAGSTSEFDLPFLTACIQMGILEHIDVVTVHPYRNPGTPESANSDYAILRSWITTYAPASREIAIWSGEWGYNMYVPGYPATWPNISEMTHAKYLSRMVVNNMSQGIENTIWFTSHPYEGWGLINLDTLSPRMAHTAMRVLNDHLDVPVAHIEDPYAIYGSPEPFGFRSAVFEHTPGHRTVALWSQRTASDSHAGVTTTVNLAVSEEAEIRAYDGLSGELIDLSVSHPSPNQTTLSNLRIWDYPIFLEVDSPLNYFETLPEGENLALNAFDHASDSDYSAAYGPEFATDGVVDIESKWTSLGTSPPHWLAVDLGIWADVTGAVVVGPGAAAEWPDLNPKTFEIQTSDSLAGPWTSQSTETNTFQHDRVITIFDEPVQARCVRLLISDTGIDFYARIPEFEIYGAPTPLGGVTLH